MSTVSGVSLPQGGDLLNQTANHFSVVTSFHEVDEFLLIGEAGLRQPLL